MKGWAIVFILEYETKFGVVFALLFLVTLSLLLPILLPSGKQKWFKQWLSAFFLNFAVPDGVINCTKKDKNV